jgi:hypothetical protein
MVKKVKRPKNVKKIIVFDLDETIGAFPALSGVLYSMKPYLNDYSLLRHMLHTNPSYFRPHMKDILRQLHAAKNIHSLTTVLYTSNPNSEWIRMILHYINEELNVQKPLFDHILDASQRTTYDKTVDDLLHRTNCLGRNDDFRIFFVDDQYHPGMIGEQVVYFHITPYNEPNPKDVHPSYLLFNELRNFITNSN